MQNANARSNNTNKLSPQELYKAVYAISICSNNTNKLSPQEPIPVTKSKPLVQIIQINLVLKNIYSVAVTILPFK